MKSILAAAFVGLGFLAPVAQAQSLITADLRAGDSIVFTHRMEAGETHREIAFRCAVPANNIGVITVAKQTPGPAQHQVFLSKSIGRDARGNIVPQNVLNEETNRTRYPSVVIAPLDTMDSVTTHHIVTVKASDAAPTSYRVYCDRFNLYEPAMWGLGNMLFTYLLDGNSYTSGDNVGRALNLGVSILDRNNVAAMGIDVFQEELAIHLSRQFPNNRSTVAFLTSFIGNMAQDIYKNALYEISPRRQAR